MIEKIVPIPAFQDNYIWALHDADSNRLAVVDPGDAGPVMAYLKEQGLELSHVLVTHHHPDHVGGLATLIENFHPQVVGPEPSGIKGIDRYLHEHDQLDLFGQNFQVYEVPGHTLDHIAYYSETADPPMLFCGDTLFAAGCGRLFEGSPEMMAESLAKLTRLPGNTRVYCTHEYTMANLEFAVAADGDNESLKQRVQSEQAKRDKGLPTLPSTISLELATNPFLRCQNAEVVKIASAHTDQNLQDPVATFAALRSWKDNF